MKKLNILAVLLFLFVANSNFAQTLSSDQQSILDQFGLEANDHRSAEFQLTSASRSASYPNLKNAIEVFFSTSIKRDYTVICVNTGNPSNFNQVYSILELVDLYISLSNDQTYENE